MSGASGAPAPFDLFATLQREIDRNARRARNGLQVLVGPGTPVGRSPKLTVWRRDKAELWRYPGERVRFAPPLLMYLGLVSRSYVLDLHPRQSFVASLRDAGFDVFLLDWGVPDEADAANTLETYVDGYLPEAVAAALEASGARELSILGYCMGACLSLMYLAGHPEAPVRNLVTMAAPVDFSKMGDHLEPIRSGRLDPTILVDEATGNMPGDVIRTYFRMRKPTSEIVQYVNLWENLWNDEFVEGFQAMGQWVRDQIPFPGAALRQVVDMWVRDDGFVNDKLALGGRRLDLRSITCPLLHILAEKDDIVPPGAAEPLPGLVGSRDVETVRLNAGHVSLAMGRHAAKVTIPAIVRWLSRRSDAVGEREPAAGDASGPGRGG
jgi:polyhydroxyalkanoate synthase